MTRETVGLLFGQPAVIDLDAPEWRGVELYPSVREVNFSPRQVADLVFGGPPKAVTEWRIEAAVNADDWVRKAGANYRNRIALLEKLNIL